MNRHVYAYHFMLAVSVPLLLAACATGHYDDEHGSSRSYSRYHSTPESFASSIYEKRLPEHLDSGGKRMVLVDPNVHSWGAYDESGTLIRAGRATAGASTCPFPDQEDGNCHTGVGTFHIASLGDGDCYSREYPKPHGGGLMPYCMFFNRGQALHGSPDPIVVENNISHGCVRMRIADAEWMRYNFAEIGTKVVVRPYND